MRWTQVNAVIGGAALALALMACGKGDAEPASERPSAEPAVGEPAFDAAALAAKLQGEWRVVARGAPQYRFEVAGDDITVVDERFSEPSEQRGKLEIVGPHRIGVRLADGTVHRYDVAEVDGALRMGLGTLARVDDLDAFAIPLTTFERLVREGGACTWVKEFGETPEERPVACELAEADGRRVLRYQAPDSFKQGELADHELLVVDGFLIDERLFDSVATKQE